MGKVRIANRFTVAKQSRLLVKADSNAQYHLLKRAIKVASAAKKRLGSNPRRIDTGLLRASIVVEPIKGGDGGARVGTNVEYALFVHNGTSKMAPNPFLTDALRQVIGSGG